MKKIVVALFAVAFLLALPAAKANVVITDSTTSFAVGIGPDGELYDSSTGVGVRRLSDGYDPLQPGSPRDSWGVSTSSGSAFADYVDFGTSGISGTVVTSTANTASYLTTTTVGVTVGQNYSFVAPNVLEIATTITNTGAASDVMFQRDIDWDVFPTEFNENTFAGAIPGSPVIDSTYYGFDNPDPTVPYGASCAGGCNNQGDLGGGIKLDLGILGTGQSASFNFFYAINQSGENVNSLDAQLSGFGASYIVSTQSSENGDYPNLGSNSAAIGYGPSMPEPSSVALFVTALAGFGGYAWRRRKSA